MTFWAAWCHVAKPRFAAIISAPRVGVLLSQQYFATELRKLAIALKEAGGKEVTHQSLWQAIKVYDQMRDLLLKVYERRKLPVPPLSGAEVLGITTDAMVMEPTDFNSELGSWLPYIKGRDSGLRAGRPRILPSSDMLGIPVLDLEGREFFDTPAARLETDRKLEAFLDSCIQNRQARPAPA